MINYKEEILRLKEEKNAVILAHYYVRDEIQEIADYVGDSYNLSKIGLEVDNEVIVFCGVSFMAESAKILSPHKKVLLPNTDAKCSMVDLATKEDVLKLKEIHKDAKIVSYVNSSTEVKAISDVCCTSANAYNVVNNIDAEEIIFIPDKHLGSCIQEKVKDKKMILYDGFCCVHNNIRAKDILDYREKTNMDLHILVHPECRKEVRDLADYIGSTGQIIDYVGTTNHKDFLILTEDGILYELRNRYKDRRFHNLDIICNPMKCITIEDVYESLLHDKNQIIIDEDIRISASRALFKMLELA
ncbi:quinolinate synthase NadA [Tissierella pigra]|uniref:Quinolinate synthase n=1 Tax=Tissierella pigra TaxID=2607614 RepID=A0A6N7Y2Q2_9FIRM|nr:quinolinate synthase NadA [Tissierella pigra]MBU5427343.1 quinolinate synthase NadA [Tissierella pigra]MSU03055.1 quinolinate synthase NadA [Tissierella pigra]